MLVGKFAGHKDEHSVVLNYQNLENLEAELGIPRGHANFVRECFSGIKAKLPNIADPTIVLRAEKQVAVMCWGNVWVSEPRLRVNVLIDNIITWTFTDPLGPDRGEELGDWTGGFGLQDRFFAYAKEFWCPVDSRSLNAAHWWRIGGK